MTFVPPKDLDAYRYLYSILAPRKWMIGCLIALILTSSLLEAVSVSLLVPVTQALSADSSTVAPAAGLFGTYESWLAGYAQKERLALLGLALLALFGLKNGLQYLRGVLTNRFWLDISTQTRLRVLDAVLKRPYAYFLERKHGALVQQLHQEPHHLAFVVQEGIEQVSGMLSVAVLIGLLVLLSWQTTSIVVIIGAVYGLVIWRLSRHAHQGGKERQAVETETVALLTEAVAGIRQVKVFGVEARTKALYEGLVKRLQALIQKQRIITLIPHHVTELFWVGILVLLLCLPALGVIRDIQTMLPIMAVFAAVAFRVGPYMSRISQGWLNLRFFRPALQIVAQQLAVPEPTDRMPGIKPFQTLQQGIWLEDVSFAYENGVMALSRVSAEFKRGRTTAIIGPSGSGKSTLVDLLLRLYEPSSGRLVVDGFDLRDFDLLTWLSAIGFVSQDTFIFHGTIRENIAFSWPDTTIEKVRSVARLANAHEFIERLPQGYDTVIGDRGLKLSGGERQRIAIARALLRDPQILIFDEATSALDSQSEAMIQDTIAGIAKDRTVILIAHRFSSVVQADNIIVLEQGTVVEEGTHAALVSGGGLYATLFGKDTN